MTTIARGTHAHQRPNKTQPKAREPVANAANGAAIGLTNSSRDHLEAASSGIIITEREPNGRFIPKVTDYYVTFQNTKGKIVKAELQVGDACFPVIKDASNILKTVATTFSANAKNKSYLTPKETAQMTESVYLSASRNKYTQARNPLDSYDRLIKQCTDKNSDGGANITEHEQALILECLHKWTLT